MAKPRYDAAKAVLANLPAPSGEADDYWERNLELNEKQRILSTLRNAFLILTRDDRWTGVLAFDEFANQVVKLKAPPYEHGASGPWGDVDDSRTMIWLSHVYRVNVEHKILIRAVVAAANERPVHPVRDYFSALEWDGKPRASCWLPQYLGAEDNDYSRAAGLKFLIGAVARVMRPGCKMDNVLILEGPQGRWKSTALAVLAEPWFSDTPFTIGHNDAFLVIRGNLIMELAELDGFTRAESKSAKAFFSSARDMFVPKYVAWSVRVPRQCVFAGTVNHGTYLRDTTGNRRYWPVKIRRADVDAIRADRDQIWAEAVHAYRAGTRWWVEEEEHEMFTLEQELRNVGDAFEDKIGAWLLGKTEVTMEQILADCLHLEVSKWSKAEQTRIGEVMHAIGWERRRHTGGRRDYYYARIEREPGEEG